MDEGVTLAVSELQRFLIRIVIAALYQTNLSTVAFGGFHLGNGGAVRQADQRFDAVFRGSQCNALGVIAGRAGDDALCLFLVGQHGNFIGRASDLEGSGDLQVFRLQIQLTIRGNAVGPDHIGFPDDAFEHRPSVKHFIKR